MRRNVLILLCLLAVSSTGCLVMNNSEEKRTGKYISPATYDQIKPGATTQSWVQATVGDPTTKSKTSDSEVWKYQYAETQEKGNAILFIFLGNNRKETTGATYIELKDGVVTNAWRD